MNIEQMNSLAGTQPTSTPSGGMTVQQMNQIMSGGKMTPDKSSAALGHSNSLVGNILSGAWGGLTDIATGVAKGGTQTALGIGGIGQKIESGIGQAIGLSPEQRGETGIFNPQSQVGQIAQQTVQPQNMLQSAGKTAEQIGEFLLPAGMEKAAATKGASYIEKAPEALGLTGKAAGFLKGALNTALKGAIGSLSFGGVTAAQTGGDIEKTKGAAEFGGVAGGLSGILEAVAPGLSAAFHKADFKLSPAQEAKAANKIDSAAKFLTENKIVGSSQTKFARLTGLNNSLESALQSSLPEGMGVPKAAVEANINATVEKLKTEDPAIYTAAKNSADSAISLMKETKGDIVPIKNALSAKRSYGQAAFRQSRFAVKSADVVSEGSYAVEQGFQKAIEDTMASTGFTAPGFGEQAATKIKVPSGLSKYFGGAKEVTLPEFNKVYSNAITAKNLTGMARFKNDTGLLGRFFGLWVGESIGQVVAPGLAGKIVGGTIGEVASQRVPGLIRNLGERALTHPNLPESTAKVIQGVENQ